MIKNVISQSGIGCLIMESTMPVKTLPKKQYYFCEKFSKSLPKPVDSCQSGREYLFLLVIAGPLEIFYNLRDSSGVKIAAYAHHALNLKYKSAYPIKKITEAAKNSTIYNQEKKLNQEMQKLAAEKS